MPAIAGIFKRKQDQESNVKLIESMMQTMLHRTGGRYSLHCNPKTAVAGRFGSEEELFSRHQVMAVLDGKLTDQDLLREQLEDRGHPCQYLSEEALLALAFLEWKEECFKKLHGDFVCAIADLKEEFILLARGPLSKRQLYWFCDQNCFLFASEIKALLTTGLIPSRILIEGLGLYCLLGYYPLDLTPLTCVYKLLPGHYLRIDDSWSCRAYFTERDKSKIETNNQKDLIDLQTEMQNLVNQQHYHSLGCLFSGGMGSLLLSSMLSKRRGNQRLELWAVEWELGTNAAAKEALSVAEKLQIPCNIGVMKPASMLQEMMSLTWYLDEPVMNMEVWTLWKAIRTHFTSTEALYSAHGLDMVLERIQKAPDLNNSLKDVFWTPLEALKEAAPGLFSAFNPSLFVLEMQQTAGPLHILEPSVNPAYILQILSGIYQPGERLTSSCEMSYLTPFVNDSLLFQFKGLFQQEKTEVLAQFEKVLREELKFEHLPHSLTQSSKLPLPLWSDHPLFLQAFELLQDGVLVRSQLVSRSWLSQVLEDQKKRKEAFSLLLAFLQWEVWYKMFIESKLLSPPPALSILQYLQH